MKNRTIPVVAVALLVLLSTGCSRTRTFLFGRGARCGALNPAPAPAYINPAPGPCAQTRTYPAPTCEYQPCPPPRVECGCGYEYAARPYQPPPCPTCQHGYGQVVVSDPYLSGGTMPYEGQIIGSEIIPDGVPTIQSDNFEARRFDTDGNEILWEAPLPDGAQPL